MDAFLALLLGLWSYVFLNYAHVYQLICAITYRHIANPINDCV